MKIKISILLKIAFLALLFLITCNSAVFSQSFNIEWQVCYGGSEMDMPRDIIEVTDGYLIAGHTKSTDGDVSSNHGEWDIWLIKIDFAGNIMFEKTYGGSYDEGTYGIYAAHDDTYYIVGLSYSSDGDISHDHYPTSGDFWILKIDGSGNIIWEKIIGGNGHDQPFKGVATSDGGLVAAGWTGSTDGDISINYGAYDMWMVKLNSDGEIEGDFTAGTDFFENGQAIIQTSDGGYLFGGNSTMGEGGNLKCEPHSPAAEAVLIKLDEQLNIEWQNCYGGSDQETILGVIEVDDGYAFVSSSDSNDGDLTGSGWHGKTDIWVVKLDFIGNIQWQKCYGGSGYEGGAHIISLDDNTYTVVGSTRSHDGDISNNHSQVDQFSDIWIFNISDTGELLWERCFGGQGDEYVNNGIVKKSALNYIIAGETNYGPSFDVACMPHGGPGDRDFWVFEVKDTTVNVPEQPPATTGITAYPNPARDYVCFDRKGKASSGHLEISIFSASGIPVKELTLHPGETIKVWDTRTIRAGVYFYRSLRKDGTAEYGKIVLE
ncbi:MAG: T9SS type A sorting domain-containing protein [Clostridia bacterium]|nr:T9SS type A sorting domain-containing protein [Clostridia bacterium]